MKLSWLIEFYKKIETVDLENMTTDIKYPEFLNSEEKYNECVRGIRTLKQFEDFFYKLLDDQSITLVDALRIMKKAERDVILIHGNKDVYLLLDVAETFIRYMIKINEDEAKSTKEVEKSEEKDETDKKQPEEGTIECDCSNEEPKNGTAL